MQLKLDFWNKPKPPELRWEELEETAREKVVQKLARLIAKAVFPDEKVEENVDDIQDQD